ncbi:HigA family addiction module antitoxin [Epilithonimonas hispanica]|uniref:Addiction module antidote protein, HigA family n=1 Tax=Epilithonimonas hispanica TaxID=358687 RepID=A0A3D9CR74_9FLAO|nr:HigA family addiction module antitoxin [Epilithonimonas hispanica]REC68117.1 addiction module antidote protein, HigA family [Epilithonimonas hispanica]
MKRHKSLLIHPGEILREEVIKDRNLTIVEASKLLNVSRLTLSNIVNEKSGITPNMALKIAYVFGGNAELWFRLQQNYDFALAEQAFEIEGLHKHFAH